MKTNRNDSTRRAAHDDRVALTPRPRMPGLPWSLAHARTWRTTIASHVVVALVTTLLVALVRPVPPDSPVPLGPGRATEVPSPVPSPSEITVHLRGGSPSAGEPHVAGFAPHDHLGIVARHNGHRSDQARLLVRAQPLSGAPARAELFVTLDPRLAVWHEHSLRYEGRVDQTLPLAPGLWRLTFMISDRRECERAPLHVCAQVDAWLRVQHS